MKLERLIVENYRSLRGIDLSLYSLNVMIGANASGKSNVLDALRFLNQGIQEKDFDRAVRSRGNVVQLAWKGAPAKYVHLETHFDDENQKFQWEVKIEKRGYDFDLSERLYRVPMDHPREQLLLSDNGKGWWWSGAGQTNLSLAERTGCALAAAAIDLSFPGREVADFVKGWGFFDPSPSVLRRPTFPSEDEGPRLDPFGRNLAGRLFAISESKSEMFQKIVSATNDILGVPDSIEPREGDDGRIYFVQMEAGLNFPVHQLQASSGTLRMLALMTTLLGEDNITLVGIEEPENYVHPNALEAFAEYIGAAKDRLQILITTHSPLLLNFLNDPEAICIVRRSQQGTEVIRESDPAAVRSALEASGFGLGEFYETKGFGG